jgi:hypothetical protein
VPRLRQLADAAQDAALPTTTRFHGELLGRGLDDFDSIASEGGGAYAGWVNTRERVSSGSTQR